MKPISEYASYREYLKDVFEEEKRTSKRVTLGQYAKKFGLSGPGLNLILSGARNLTIANLHQIARALNLPQPEREYFEALVFRDQATDRETRSYYSKRLASNSKKVAVRYVRMSDKRLVANWLVPALLIYLIDFSNVKTKKNLDEVDLEAIAKKFRMNSSQLSKIILQLQEQGLLSIDPSDNVHIAFEKVAFEYPQKEYVRAVTKELDLRLDESFDDEDTLFRALTFSINQSQLPSLRSDILGIFNDYMAKYNPTSEDGVLIQGLVGVFPVLKK